MSTSLVHLAILDLLRFTRTHQRHHEALMRATGGHFNLFQVLGIGHYEVKTHSPILAELLNPKGRHGQGSVFLNLFLNMFGITDDDFRAEGSNVTSEYHIGTKTKDTGGRIDIVIEDGMDRRILIENKIYAGDQENQVTRYRNFDHGARIFYLTLFGNAPSNLSKAEAEAIRCEPISYQKHILQWLIACRKESACLPGVRETISQYIALIEELTHQSTTKEMNKELIEEIIDKPGNLDAFFALRDAEGAVQAELIRRLDEALDKMTNASQLKKAGPLQNFSWKYAGVDFVSPELNRLNIKVRLEFDTSGYRDFCYGFRIVRDGEECPVRSQLLELFKEAFPSMLGSSSAPWPAWNYFEDPYRDWSQKAFEDILSGKLAETIGAKLEKLSAIALLVCEAKTSEAYTIQTQP